jgi:hypothetical protein
MNTVKTPHYVTPEIGPDVSIRDPKCPAKPSNIGNDFFNSF